MKESKRFAIKAIVVITVLIGVVFYAFYYRIDDLKNVKNAETTLVRITEIRVALEEFYQKTGEYPNLLIIGSDGELKDVMGIGKNGEKIYFSKIYGRNKLLFPIVNKTKFLENGVYDVSDFKNSVTMKGGWNYNYKEKTGEIHANLPENYYQQGIKWHEE